MRALVILAHPGQDSFNHAIAKRVVDRLQADGHDAHFHDLYWEKFDPILGTEDLAREGQLPAEIVSHCEELTAADALVFVHPNWWGQPPAIMKGWVDRVFRAGMAYRFVDRGDGVGIPEGMLKADRAVILNTANSTPSSEWGIIDPLDLWWRSTVLGMCGVKHVERRLFAPVVTSSAEQREGWLAEAEKTASDVVGAVELGVG